MSTKRRQRRAPHTYNLLDVLAASPTEPMPAATRVSHLTRMWRGLAALERDANPTSDDWRVCSDAVNLMETLIDMQVCSDANGLLQELDGASGASVDRKVKCQIIDTCRQLVTPALVPVALLVKRLDNFFGQRPHLAVLHWPTDVLRPSPFGHAQVGFAAPVEGVIDIAALMLEYMLKGGVKVLFHLSGVATPIRPASARPTEMMASAMPGAIGTPAAVSSKIRPRQVDGSFARSRI